MKYRRNKGGFNLPEFVEKYDGVFMLIGTILWITLFILVGNKE